MPCPFLTSLSHSYVRNYGSNLLKTYGNHCPVASRTIANVFNTSSTTEQGNTYFCFCER